MQIELFPSPNLGLSLKYIVKTIEKIESHFRPLIWGYI